MQVQDGSRAQSQEDAGCILWDLTASEPSANFLIHHQLLQLLPLILTDALGTGKKSLALHLKFFYDFAIASSCLSCSETICQGIAVGMKYTKCIEICPSQISLSFTDLGNMDQ